jgi:tetratricopeptide (TPR) repeat protein
VLAVGVFIVGLAPLSDGDLWWHLAAGRELARTHAFLAVDPFSSGAAGRPWVDVHWLFQLAAYGAFSLGGLTLLVIGKCLLLAAGALVLLAAVGRGAGPRARYVFVVSFLAALFAARALLLLRPVIPTLLFIALYFYVLERFRQERRPALLMALPLFQIVWANVQGLSMLGPALVGAYALAMMAWAALGQRRWFPFASEAPSGVDDVDVGAGRAARALLVASALCLGGCLVTPYGVRGLALPLELLSRLRPGVGNVYAANVAENVPPWMVERAAPGQFGHLDVYLGLVALALLAARKLVLSHALIVGALVALALASNRNVLLLYWLATPIVVMAAAPTLRRLRVVFRRRRAPLIARWAGRVALAGVLIASVTAAAREPSLAEAAPWRAPTESARVIAERGGSGTILAADQFGGYLIWRLFPRFRPYIDTRLVLRTPQEFAEYLAVVDDPSRFDAWEEGHRFDYVLLPMAYPDRYQALVAHLYASERWTLIFTDGAETLFARRGAAPVRQWDLSAPAVNDRILAELDGRFGGRPRLLEAARLQLATLDLAVGAVGAAKRVLAGMGGPNARALAARCLLDEGDLDGAQHAAETLLARDGHDIASLDVMAVVEARRGDSDRAVAFLRRALDVNPFDNEAQQILNRWEGHGNSQQ